MAEPVEAATDPRGHGSTSSEHGGGRQLVAERAKQRGREAKKHATLGRALSGRREMV
jgi:hypothetical protein